jgi:acyl-coenzyme A synthetase/AMP-(fatty) acid ligase
MLKFKTSGTTGTPKEVTHSLKHLLKNVIFSDAHKSDVWGNTYKQGTIAYTAVNLQAEVNGNRIFDLSELNSLQVLDRMRELGITHISATPTWYRLLPMDHCYEGLQSAAVSGEPVDSTIIDKMKYVFPKAKVRVIYALTEAGTVMVSDNEYFEVKTDKIRIIDNEIHLHYSLLGYFDFEGEWYATGDIVEVLQIEPKLLIRVIGRKTEMINVGGYKVNPEQVEKTLRGIAGVKEARVYGIKNSITGYVIACQIVTENDLLNNEILKQIDSIFEDHITRPRFVYFNTIIDLTENMKVRRG